jgi:hypothetical protein
VFAGVDREFDWIWISWVKSAVPSLRAIYVETLGLIKR